VENIKVFELAKQMGLETIALMDKLREFKIPVKSHMAELDEELLNQIKIKFDEEKAKTPKSKTTKTVRAKKAAAPGEKAAAKKASAVPKVVKASKVAIKAGAKPETSKTAAAPKGSKAASSRTVIRRKANTQEVEAAPEMEPTEIPEVELDQETADDSIASQAASPASAEALAPTASTVQAPNKDRGRTAQVISRIDLSQNMGRPRPTQTPAAGQRPAPVTAKPQEPAGQGHHTELKPFDREEMGKLIKREALEQARKAAALARETKVETFNASDFRKRELLFQPKKKKTLVGRAAQKTQITTPGVNKRKVRIENAVTVSRLAQEMGVKTNEVLKKLIAMGTMVTVNDVIDFETAQVIATDYNFEVENVSVSEAELLQQTGDAMTDKGALVPRPPVVTVMGHVDHGKTSLLDAIRSANVAKGEAGGITQHIGAYSVDINGKKITFLDTPGHEAFTAMRSRGAKVTDIVILVVAADDGIMPQTREAITHAKSAGVPIIVAVNKMDLPGANPQKVLQGLTEFELVPEEWGGTTIIAKVSAIKKEGVKELLEMVLLQAEVLELKANPKLPASGAVVEARVERGRGTVATLLVQQGTARVGDVLVAGTASGKIRAMLNDKGSAVKEASPGTPVEVQGLDSVPNAGDTFDVVKDEELASEVIEKRLEKIRGTQTGGPLKMSLEDLFAKVQNSDVKELPILIKADVQGSAEALKDMLLKNPAEKVKVKILAANVGGINESDVLLASASHAIIIGFNVRPETGVAAIAQREGVEIKTYSIIYEIIDDIKKAMTGMLSPTYVEKAMGRAEVRSLFSVPKVGTIAGCSVIDGRITRQSQVRLLRESRIVYEGKLASLKRFKDDVKEVQNGYECGIGIENYNDLKVGDVIEAYVKEQVASLLT
jgi:translation initiation factor IF-2